ncbi:MAG: metallophosphoesterase family protein [Clostridia bacterium]|nr:metallophosphoesterase family protein [Clostridia bacterium]
MTALNNLPPLKFKDGKFKIMLAGDLHESYAKHDPLVQKKTADTTKLLNKAIDELKPDLVIYLGDIGKADVEKEMRSVISRVTYPVSAHDVPLAIVFGNHDRECELSLERQLELYAQEYDKFYTYDAVPELTGCGNCNLLIKDSAGEKDIFNLWFMDSNNLCENRNLSYYDWVHEDQIEWYKKTAAEIKEKNDGKAMPALWFMHIPVPEEYELLREAKIYEIPDSIKGHGTRNKINYVLKDNVEGYLGEGPACSEVNSGVFKAWKETGDVLGAFFGHDHMNDFAGYVDGILLAQNKLAGFRPYTDGCRSGVRLITLDENNLTDINSKMYYFKGFGLKSESLGPVQKNFSDRQVIKIKAASWIAGGVTAAITAAKVAKIIKKAKTK